MENITNEIKTKVFAQYLGQQFQTKLNDDSVKNYTLDITEMFKFYNSIGFDNVKLILKPLSSITDEDAIEISKMFLTDGNSLQSKIEFGKGVAYHYELGSYYTNRPIEIYQFLQSKGYDLSQYLLGNKTLFECGLAIYE